eukprot:1157013-Pelagomonas_calceolata.AAC.14
MMMMMMMMIRMIPIPYEEVQPYPKISNSNIDDRAEGREGGFPPSNGDKCHTLMKIATLVEGEKEILYLDDECFTPLKDDDHVKREKEQLCTFKG